MQCQSCKLETKRVDEHGLCAKCADDERDKKYKRLIGPETDENTVVHVVVTYTTNDDDLARDLDTMMQDQLRKMFSKQKRNAFYG